MDGSTSLSRRTFFQRGAFCIAAASATSLMASEPSVRPRLRVGLVADLHFGDKPEGKTRYYRETLGKLKEAVAKVNQERPAFVVELGDLIDQADSVEQEIGWLDEIEKIFAETGAPRHYVLGNHCVGTLTKAEFQAHTGAARRSHYSFEQGGVHFIVLDACFRGDGTAYERKNFDWTDANIPAEEVEWLRDDLDRAQLPVIIFAHQRLDEAGKHSVRNAAEVRAAFEKSGKVLAVFQGHSHQNDYQQLAGIHYCTLVAMVEGSGLENSGYALLDIMPDDSLRLHGFRRQLTRELGRAARSA